MTRIFLDMDGVLVDFDHFMRQHGLTGDEVKKLPGAYREMRPMEGALEGLRRLMSIAGQYGAQVWLATKPPTAIAHAYAGKVEWVLRHTPELKRRIILTHDKGLLGGRDDILVDDRPHKANCHQFPGLLLHFGAAGTILHWDMLVDRLHQILKARLQPQAPVSGSVLTSDAQATP